MMAKKSTQVIQLTPRSSNTQRSLLDKANMCIQRHTKCRNMSCPNSVQLLDVIECSRKPFCQVQLVRVPLKRNTDKVHCDSCEALTPNERHRAMRRLRISKNRSEKEKGSAQESKSAQADDDDDDEVYEAALILMAMSRG